MNDMSGPGLVNCDPFGQLRFLSTYRKTAKRDRQNSKDGKAKILHVVSLCIYIKFSSAIRPVQPLFDWFGCKKARDLRSQAGNVQLLNELELNTSNELHDTLGERARQSAKRRAVNA